MCEFNVWYLSKNRRLGFYIYGLVKRVIERCNTIVNALEWGYVFLALTHRYVESSYIGPSYIGLHCNMALKGRFY